MHFLTYTLLSIIAISNTLSAVIERRAQVDCIGNNESAPARAARLTAWVATTAAAKTAETALKVAKQLEKDNRDFATGYTNAAEREVKRVEAVTWAANAAATAVAAAAYGTRMVAGLEPLLWEVCGSSGAGGTITGQIIASLDNSGALYFHVDLKDIPMGSHEFHIHHSTCGSSSNPHFAHGFPALVGDYKNKSIYEFSTSVNDVTEHCKTLGVTDLKSGLDAGGRSIILHVGGEKICGDFVEQNDQGGHDNYVFSFE
jgi:Cu/Zn superoxide dismutase